MRSSFPPAFRKFMTELLKNILTKVDKNKIDEMVIKFKNLMKTFRPVAKKYGNKLSYVVETGIKKYVESRI